MNKMTPNMYEKTIQSLLEKITVLENKLQSHSGDKRKFVACFKQLESEITYLRAELSKSTNEIAELTEQSNSYQKQIALLTEQHKAMVETYRMKFDMLSRELEQKASEIAKLDETVEAKDTAIKTLSVSNSLSMRKSDNYQDELERQRALRKRQKMEIDELEKEINTLYMNKKSEGNLLLENEHLKEDALRLLNMLQATEEYHDFGYLNSTIPGGIRYVSEPKLKQRKTNNNTKSVNSGNNSNNTTSGNEVLALQDAFNVVNEYRTRFNIDINDKLIRDILLSLNHLWRDKQAKTLIRLKAKFQQEIVNIKNKYGINMSPISTAQSTSQNGNSIDTSNNAKGAAKRKIRTANDDEYTKSLVESAKKVANDFSSSKQQLQKQIDVLKTQIADKNYCTYASAQKKMNRSDLMNMNHIITDKACNELNKLETQFTELYNEYKVRVKDTETMINKNGDPIYNIKMINNTVKWLIKSMNDNVVQTRKRFELWKSEYTSYKKV